MAMKLLAVITAVLAVLLSAGVAPAQPTSFKHIVVIIQENRTPDNLFYALCSTQRCTTDTEKHPNSYDIQIANWLDKNTKSGVVQPKPVPLANDFDAAHSHTAFAAMCDRDGQTGGCKMDGAGDIQCANCPPHAEFKYVDNSLHVIDPYLFLATQYGWANYMFQTNQGPSFPAHQFLFGGTSAPSLTDDHKGTFASENLPQKKIEAKTLYGCIAESNRKVQLINSKGVEGASHLIYPCFEHLTLADLLDAKSVTWRYYTPGAGDIWSAPDAIKHICQPSGRLCTGPLWQNNVALSPPDVLEDLSICNLRDVSWVIPSAQYSDHPKINTGLGPSWVAAVVNAIGNSRCRDADGSSYWDSTAILLTWDDWGGWYDHEPPTFLPYPEGGYQYGFRVPFIFISAYSPRQFINNQRLDFGSVARFIEFNFGITMGALTFSDARSGHDLSSFYDFGLAARSFQTVPAPPFPADAAKMKLEPPDDD